MVGNSSRVTWYERSGTLWTGRGVIGSGPGEWSLVSVVHGCGPISHFLLRGLSLEQIQISGKSGQHSVKTEDSEECVDHCSSPHLSNVWLGEEEQEVGQGEGRYRVVWV